MQFTNDTYSSRSLCLARAYEEPFLHVCNIDTDFATDDNTPSALRHSGASANLFPNILPSSGFPKVALV